MNVIQDVPIADYVRRAGVADDFVVRDLGEGAQIGALMLAKAWIHTGLWAPITLHATTMEDFFRVYSASRHDALYRPETLGALSARAQAGVRPANDKLAFALGGDVNYRRLLKDYLPRLALYFGSGLEGAPLLVPAAAFGAPQQEILAQVFEWAGKAMPGLVKLADEYAAVGPTVFPSLVSTEAAARIWRGALRPPALTQETGRRLFVMCQGVRGRLVNQDDIAARLAREGFVCIEPETLSFPEQVAAFQGASLVVGVHGAGLANLFFAPDACTVVELTPDRDRRFYKDIATARKWTFTQLSDEGGQGDHNRDFAIDPARIEEALAPVLVR